MLPSGRAARIQARELCIAAQGAFRNGDVDKAITSYEQAVKVDNQCKESYIGLAAALTSQERFAEAAKHLRVALKLDPSYIVAQFDMGSLCHRQGNLGEATRYYNRVLRLARDQGLNIAEVSSGAETLRLLHDNAAASHALTLPGSAHRPPQNATEDAIIATRVNIGLVFLSTSRLEEAMRHFLSAIQLDSSRADVFTHLASCMYTMGYTIRQVSRFYEESVRLDSSFVPGLVGCAVCEEARGNLPKAAEILTRAITVRDNDPALWFRLGQIYLVSGRESEAADCFSKTTTLQSDSIDAWFSWGVALHGLGRLDEATTQFKAALAIDSNHRPAQYRLALIAKQQGNEAKLLTSLLQAVSDVDLTPGAPPMEPPADEAAAHDRYLELVALGNTYIDLNRTLEALPAFQQATQCDSKGVWGWFGVGFCQHRAGSLVEAEAAYNTCLRIEPGFGRAYFNLGVIHEANKDFEEAERCFGRAGKDSSGHGGGSLRHDAAVALAGVFLKRRKTQEAIQQARSVLSAVPAHPRALLLLGMAFERGNQLKHAQEQLQSANDLLMTHGVVDERVVAGLALATVQHHQGEYSSASGYYRRTLDLLQATADSPDRPKEAVNGLGPGLGLDGGGASTLNTYGGIVGMTTARVESLQVITMCNYAACLESMGDRDDAMSLYNEVLKLDSSNATAMKALERAKAEVEADAEASSAYLQAIEQHRKGNFEGAMKHYQAALEKDPENGLAMYGIGVCHFRSKQFGAARDYFKRAIVHRPRDAAIHAALGAALHGQRKHTDAETSIRDAIELDSSVAASHASLGQVLQAQGRHDAAVASWHAAIDLDPRLPRAHYHLATSLLSLEQYQEAIAALGRAMEADRADYEAGMLLVECFRRQNRLEDGVVVLQDLLRLPSLRNTVPSKLQPQLDRPIDADSQPPAPGKVDTSQLPSPSEDPSQGGCAYMVVLLQLAQIQHEMSRLDDATKGYVALLRLQPYSLAAHLGLAACAEARSDFVGALALYKQAARLYPKEPMLADRLKDLESHVEALQAEREAGQSE